MEIGRVGAAMEAVATRQVQPPNAAAAAASMQASFHFDWQTAFKAEREFSEQVHWNHRYLPMMQANGALRTIEEQLGAIQKTINLTRPDIRPQDWDFSVKDGEIKVTGALEAQDRERIEQVLKGNEAFVAAAKSYVSAAVAYLETSADNPVYGGQNRFTGRMVFYDFKNIEKQLGEHFRFKEVIATAHELYRNTRTGEAGDAGDYLGGDSLEIFASKLNPKAVATHW